MTKERETETRDIPPKPPIESKGKEKERASKSIASTRARARDPLAALTGHEIRLLRQSYEPGDRDLIEAYVHDIPSLERAVGHARAHGFTDDFFVEQWYEAMDSAAWCDRYGMSIRNWCALLARWIRNRAFFEALMDPDRLPDVRKTVDTRRKADNWRGTRKEDIGDVLG